MNQIFRRMPLPAKLVLMALIPLALLLYFASQIYEEKSEKIAILNGYLQRVDESARISAALDELQTERRYSFGFVIDGEWKGEMLQQRARTDNALRGLAGNPQQGDIRSYTFLDTIGRFRKAIDNGAASPAQVMNYYTNALFRLNTLNVVSAGHTSYLAPVRHDLMGQKLLSEMITYMGIIRSQLYYSLHIGQPAREAAESLRSLYDIYLSYEQEFLQKASPAAITAYRNIAVNTDLNPTVSFIELLLGAAGYDARYSEEDWWTVSANGVDELKRLQRSLSQKVQQGMNGIYNRERASRDRSLLYLILSIVLVGAAVTYTIVMITRILNELNTAAGSIATGAVGIPLRVDSDDVIGGLAASIRRIEQNNSRLAKAADAIGSGQFDVEVVPRSKEDILGIAIKRMKQDLRRFHRENEEKLWIHTGLEKVNEQLRGEKDLHQLAADALAEIVTHVDGAVGLLYVRYDNRLRYTAGYAVAAAESVPQELAMGETLVGQAASKKQVLHLKDVPPDAIRIKSGSLEAAPASLLLVPLLHNEGVEGIAEIGALAPFSDRALDFIRQVTPAVAIALQGARNRARLQELLEQTQAQAAELQAQHGELENINAELEAQTEKLQASEEELKVQQEELLQANQELEERSRLLEERNQLIVERNTEIQRKAEELEQSTRYKSEFLANMSHELRTPLNSILLLSRLMAENNEKNLTAEQVEYAQVIQGSGQGLLSLIDEILDLSKIEAGKMELEFHPVLLQEVLQDMKMLFAPMAREKGLELLITADEGLPSQIETDKLRLEQVLKNLLSNALKFTSKGSVSLRVGGHPDAPGQVTFTVQDTGIGIPKEKQGLIFEAFQQADGSTRRKFGGTGLGLSISRELTRLLGGAIGVSSEDGKGSTFTVTLPVSRTAAATHLPAPAPALPTAEMPAEAPKPQTAYRTEKIPESLPDDRAAIGAGDKTILIVEDDTAFARALLDFTRKKGYKGLVAVRGDEGIALAQQYLPVGILLDLQLPVQDGWEVMEALKSNPATRPIPVHIMSSQEAKKESLVKGAIDFINKPLAFEQMQDVFRKIEHVVSKENKKVLIVEENPRHARALAYFLETYNVNTQIFGSIGNSVEALQQEAVDCVILDMGIPDQHAYETLEALRKEPGLEHLPIIIFTGKSLSKTEESRIRQYADSIVIKTAHSYQRIIDEVSLFLHLVEESGQREKGTPAYKRLGALNEVLAGKKVLVTDDDVRNIFSLTKALELHDMKVITAVDGREALQQLEEHPDTSLVLMDIMMPEMDGYEAMQAIRKKAAFRNLPIIAVTAKAMTGDREKCIRAGASDYISKPVDIDQLLSLLRVWLYDKTI